MAATWKILAALALFLLLPAGAYVTGAWVGPPPAAQDNRAQLVDQDRRVPAAPAPKEKDRPSGGPTELVAATDDGPATDVRPEPSAPETERGGADRKRHAERKPATTESPSAAAGNEPSEEPSPTESPEPSEAPETEEPAPTESPTPSESPDPEPTEPSPSVTPTDEAEGVVGS